MFLGRGHAKGPATALAELLDDDVDGFNAERFVDLLAGKLITACGQHISLHV